MNRDTKLFSIIEKELARQREGIELIASENFASKQVMEAVGSVFTNKYAEGYPGKRYYGGCEFIDEAEQLAIDRACELFGAEYANVQPHSGAQANAAVMLALLKPGDKILGLDLSHGGHLTHGSPVNMSGKWFEAVSYGLNPETGTLDYDQIEEIALNERPRMIIGGASAYSRDWDWERLRKIADEINALLLGDISHPSGIIAKKHLNDPLPYCHVVTTTTHKTLRGPRGGLILMGKDFPNFMGQTTGNGKRKRMSTLLNAAVFPGIQGGPLEHVIAGKAVAFGEALTDEFDLYIQRVVANAKEMAQQFNSKDYKIVTGGTDNHIILLDLRNKGVSGKDAEIALEYAGITVNKNMVPFDDQPPMITSGIRIGTPAITTRGMKEEDMKTVVEFIDRVINNYQDETTLKSVKEEIKHFTKAFPLYEE